MRRIKAHDATLRWRRGGRALCDTKCEPSSVAIATKALGEIVFTPYAMSSVSFWGAGRDESHGRMRRTYMLGSEGMHLERQLDVVVRFIRS